MASVHGCSCGGDESSPGDAGGGTDAKPDWAGQGGSGGSPEAASGGMGGSVYCMQGPQSSIIPDGWKRFPGLPCECDIWYAPDPSLMGPQPSWITTPPGVLELENNWAGQAHRFYTGTARGDAASSRRYVTHLRDLGSGNQETVVIDVSANTLAFQAKLPGGFLAGCHARVQAFGQGVTLLEGWADASGGAKSTAHVLAIGPPEQLPKPFMVSSSLSSAFTHAVSTSLAAWEASQTRVDVFRLDGTKTYSDIASSIGTILKGNDQIFAWDELVFFDAGYQKNESASWVWDPIAGARRVVPITGLSPGEVGATCGAATDGNTVIWTQSSGWNGSGWEASDVMVAAYSKGLANLQPKKLRAFPNRKGTCIRWRLGAGYAGTRAAVEAGSDGGNGADRTIVVRLADGAMWEIPERPGRYFGAPLYVTDAEVALAEGLTLPNDAGVTEFESWAIVRYPISLLGAPSLP